MPFPRNADFVGRTDDLDRLHAVLQTRRPVGIRPAGLTGMGGIGKTQLAVEYVYRHKDDYPGGIFWVNAAEPLAQGLAQVGARLRPETLDQSPNHQLRAAFEELNRRPDALIVFDNLDDPAQLDRPVGLEASPSTLACRILFTTRRPDLGRFQPVEITVLPEEPALQLLLRHESRRAVRDDPDHPERPEAGSICRLLGWLPLALELAGAFLAEWPDISLADYRKRLQAEGLPPHSRSRGRQPRRGQLPADPRGSRRGHLENAVGRPEAEGRRGPAPAPRGGAIRRGRRHPRADARPVHRECPEPAHRRTSLAARGGP